MSYITVRSIYKSSSYRAELVNKFGESYDVIAYEVDTSDLIEGTDMKSKLLLLIHRMFKIIIQDQLRKMSGIQY
mgnify:CR=1 FL=1